MQAWRSSTRTNCLVVVLMSLATVMSGCGWGLARTAKLSGKALLAGAPAGGHGGILVDISSMQHTTTLSDGSYTLSGVINGDDPYLITFTKDGYQTMTYEGTFKRPTDSDDFEVAVPTVTLSP